MGLMKFSIFSSFKDMMFINTNAGCLNFGVGRWAVHVRCPLCWHLRKASSGQVQG